MAFPALLSELYGSFRRKVGADERPARVVAEASVIEDARFRGIDKKFDALSHTMDQRFDALSQRFNVLNQPSDGLSRVMPNALTHLVTRWANGFTRRTNALAHLVARWANGSTRLAV